MRNGRIFYGENEFWFKDGKCHREDGPAIIYPKGSPYFNKGYQEWWLNDRYLKREEWWKAISDEMKLKALFNGENYE
jgi:hypothetical protein